MIHYVKGDLLASDCHIIAHGCNCFCVMGAGIAKQIALKYPEAATVDKLTVRGDIGKLGLYSAGFSKKDEKIIFNLYTQYSYGGGGRQVNYTAIKDCFELLHQAVNDLNTINNYPHKVGIPRIGAGLGGGDWNQIEKIIQEVYPSDIYVYSL